MEKAFESFWNSDKAEFAKHIRNVFSKKEEKQKFHVT
jgi:hypothetical protein